MKLVVFGFSVSSTWANGSASLWRGLIKALAAQKHTVTFYERDTPVHAAHRDWTDLPNGKLVLYSDFEEVRRDAASELQEADAGLVTSCCPDVGAACALVMDTAVPIRAFYDLDPPRTLARAGANAAHDASLPRDLSGFDVVLSYIGGKALTELQHVLKAKRVVPLYGAVDPHLHSPAAPLPQYQSTLSHLGAYAPEQQQALDRLFLAPARARSDLAFAVAGPHYHRDFAWSPNIKYLWHVPSYEESAFFCSARLNLLLTRAPFAALGFCPSARMFEAAACGAAVITDHWVGLEAFYEAGQEVLVARETGDVLAALELSERELIGMRRRALERTLAEHTVVVRARRLVDVLGVSSYRAAEREGAESTREI